jgi:putative ubiquitin-RnfH superfamily antitoxin RatB of RatAB toxin-antitoxin module
MSKRCTVACDTPAGILVCELELPDDATIAVALIEARHALGDSAADWEHAATGVYGKVYGRAHVPADGDRIELYRPLNIDPRAQRRARAEQAARAGREGSNRRGHGSRRR